MRMKLGLFMGLSALILAFQNCAETLPSQSPGRRNSVPILSADPIETSNPSGTPELTVPPGTPPQVAISGLPVQASFLTGSNLKMDMSIVSNTDLANCSLKFTVINDNQNSISTTVIGNQAFLGNQANRGIFSVQIPEGTQAGHYLVSVEILSSSQNVLSSTLNLAEFNILPPIRVAVGRATAYTDLAGRVWSPDSGFTGVSVATTEPLSTLVGSVDSELYSSFRYGQNKVTGLPTGFTFTASIPGNGNYKVTLKFVEHYFLGPGRRVFDVAINNVASLTGFDIFQSAGGGFIAHDRSSVVAVTNDATNLRVSFTPRLETPKINAIEILGAP